MSLGNVLSATSPNQKIPFIKESDADLYNKWSNAAFEVQVGLHELLGTVLSHNLVHQLLTLVRPRLR